MNFEIHKINFQPYFTIFQHLRVGLKWQIVFTLQFFWGGVTDSGVTLTS